MIYRPLRTLIRPLVMLAWRPHVEGAENIPKKGPVLLVANHLANVDSFVLPIVVPRKMRFIIKADYWHQTGFTARIKRWFFEETGSVPVERGTVKSAKKSLEAALQILNEGGVFNVYPEGTRSKDGKLHAGKQGAAWLAQMSGAPVVPVGLIGTERLFVKGSKRPRFHRFTVKFGHPIDFSDLDEVRGDAARRLQMTERIMQEIQTLTEQERA